tara:strand:+ start:2048 stop:2506 length:459 start_codon:yes stop_codon:yes gene_type:complete
MKNILGTIENLTFYNKEGVLVYKSSKGLNYVFGKICDNTMKNILGTTKNLTLYSKDGFKIYKFYTSSRGYLKGCSRESTFDKSGNELTYINSLGDSLEKTYDKSGNELTYKSSFPYSYEYTRDENGNELTFKNSLGESRGFNIPEFTIQTII